MNMSIKFKVASLLIIVIINLLIFESLTCGQESSFSSDNPLATKSDINSKSLEIFSELDMHALNAPERAENSIESLAAYLTKPAKNDTEKVRAIYRWIAENIDYDVQGFSSGSYGDTSAEGVLKSGRSVCGGYSNLFEKLANASGLDAVTISGYAKGYGYTPGMRFSGPTDHAWNAVKIEEKWYLIDSTWGAGSVDNDGKYNREFDDDYFLTPSGEFIYRHFPENPNWQLLDEPISKKDFEDLVYLEPTFFDLGMRIGNQKNVTIISNGQANISLYAPKDVFLSAELEMRSRNGIPRVAYGSPTLVKRSGEQYIIELLPPFPGEYSLQIYGKRDNSKGLFEQVMEYNIEELSGSNRSFPIVSDEFFDLGFRLDNKTNGMIVAKGDANLTLDVPTDVLMIASLEKLGEGKISPTDYSKSVFVQRSGDQYEITLSPPTTGEYILNIFAKQKDDSSNSYPMVMQFNVSALSGSNRSFPETFGGFQEMGVYLFSPMAGEVKAAYNQTFKIKIPGAKEVAVISGDRWNYLTKNGDIFQGNAIIKKGDVDVVVKLSMSNLITSLTSLPKKGDVGVAVKLSGESGYSTIIRYRAF